MKLLLVTVVFALVTVGYANSVSERRERRQLLEGVDAAKVPSMLNNPAFVNAQHRCIMADDTSAASLCDRIGKRLREHLRDAMVKADCPGQCTVDEKKAIVEVIATIQTKYPKIWQDVIGKYAITPEQVTAIDQWVEKVKSENP